MTQDEADKELGRIVRKALMKGIIAGSACEVDVAMDLLTIGPISVRIRVGPPANH